MKSLIKFKMVDGCLDLSPAKAHADDAAYDISSRENTVVPSGKFIMVKTGIHLALPSGWEAQIRPRSGLAAKHGITVLNTPGTIDAGYRGEIGVVLHNVSENDFPIVRGQRIAQMVLQKLSEADLALVDELDDDTCRGAGGFGSTGHY